MIVEELELKLSNGDVIPLKDGKIVIDKGRMTLGEVLVKGRVIDERGKDLIAFKTVQDALDAVEGIRVRNAQLVTDIQGLWKQQFELRSLNVAADKKDDLKDRIVAEIKIVYERSASLYLDEEFPIGQWLKYVSTFTSEEKDTVRQALAEARKAGNGKALADQERYVRELGAK
jgi:hypothetical protein